MALRNPPSWLQNGSHPAENDRLTTTQVIWDQAGIVDYGDMKVSQSATPAMSVQVSDGHALILGTETATQSQYIAYNDAAVTLAIAAANPTNARIDRVVIAVQDSYYSGANNQVLYQVVTGTPSGSPVAPSAPANSITLAYVLVGAGVTTIVDANITDTRTFAKMADVNITATNVAANSLTVDTINLQTGKAIRINDSTGSQVFAISPAGVLTFADGSLQSTAATYDPNIVVNTQTGTTYSVLASDAQKIITCNNSSDITVTINSNATTALPVGTQFSILQLGTGQVNVTGAVSPNPVTIYANPGKKTRAQYSLITLIQLATDTWLLTGDATA